jgi:membrane-associated phospholipid phosphatase
MRRYLLVALLPVGLAAIAATTALAARRAAGSGPAAEAVGNGADLGAEVAASAAGLPGHDAGQPSEADSSAKPSEVWRSPASAADATSTAHEPSWQESVREVVPDLIRLGAIGGAGGFVAYQVLAALGPPIVNHGLTVDEPIFRWTSSHQVDWFAAGMERLNKIGNTWTAWGAVAGAAACLGVGWRRQRWLPPAALASAMLVDYCSTHTLHRKVNRLGPPTHPLGTYPAGGVDRVILFSGLIAHLLWHEFSGTEQGKIVAIGSVAALAYNQAYCREYLSQHWFIDIVCGVLYGVLLLLPFNIAVRLITGPATRAADRLSKAVS